MLIYSCNRFQEDETPSPAAIACVESVMALDDSLGRVRNHLSEMIPVHESIEHYVQSSEIYLNFEDCPALFQSAFQRHTNAWKEMAKVCEEYAEYRGEMHSVMDRIAIECDCKEFNEALSEIWESWAEVENVTKRYQQALE